MSLVSTVSLMIEDWCLGDQRLRLGLLSDSHIASGELVTISLEELFELTDECSYLPTSYTTFDQENKGKGFEFRVAY